MILAPIYNLIFLIADDKHNNFYECNVHINVIFRRFNFFTIN